jgi:hypothetical protein
MKESAATMNFKNGSSFQKGALQRIPELEGTPGKSSVLDSQSQAEGAMTR